jgi:hypothetical protein
MVTGLNVQRLFGHGHRFPTYRPFARYGGPLPCHKGRREYILGRLESGIHAGHTLVARQWAACKFSSWSYPLNGDADETISMALFYKR